MKTIKSNFTVPIVLAVALVLILSATFALFTETQEGTRRFTVSNFTSSVEVSFDNFTTTVSGTTVGGAKSYAVSLISGAGITNYIGDLRVRVKYNGKGVGLLRVRVTEEWYEYNATSGVTTVKPYAIEMPYWIGDPSTNNGANNANLFSGSGNQSKWFDNRTNDYCYYYATPLSRNTEDEIDLITGVNMSSSELSGIAATGTNVNIIIEADVVQVNRYPQYWELTKLPWTSASSLGSNAS